MPRDCVVESEYRCNGIECRYYRNWLGRQIILLRRLILVLSYFPDDERRELLRVIR